MRIFINNLSLKAKILSIVSISIVLFSCVTMISLWLVVRSYDQLLHRTLANSLHYSGSNISDNLDSILNLSSVMIADASVQENLSVIKDYEDNYVARQNTYQRLYSVTNSYFNQFKQYHLSYLMISSNRYTANTYASNTIPDSVKEDIVSRALEGEGAPVWITNYSDEYGLILAREIRRIENYALDSLGVLIIGLDVKEMVSDATDFGDLFENSSYILYDGENLIYHPEELSEKLLEQPIALNGNYGVIKLDGKKYFMVKDTLPSQKWDYICMASYEKINAVLSFAQTSYIFIIILCVIISFAVSACLVNSINRHFTNLKTKIKAFGKLEEPDASSINYDYSMRTDEIGVLHNQFDKMALQINQLIKDNFINHLLMKDAQINALKSQMNPHFLYNTLESINWRAKAVGEKDISTMIEALGSVLRAALSNTDETATLKEEMQLVQSYITIQQLRFEERLCFTVSVKQELLAAQIPKLTLQPLVENAIHYGLEINPEDCLVEVIVTREADILIIYVKNTSSQFAEDLLKKLESKEITPERSGIGLLNINKRLKLIFGEAYGLTLYNEEEKAVAQITIPFQVN